MIFLLKSSALSFPPFLQALHFVTTRQTRERDKRAVMGLLGGSWDAELDGGDPVK